MKTFKAIILCLIATYSTSSLSEIIIIGGSGADLATFKLLTKKFKKINPGVKFKILPSIGSGGGVKAAQSGKIDLCLTSRAPKDKEKKLDLIFKHYAQTPFVFAVNEDLDIDNLTTQNILDIYSGKMTQWDINTQIKPVLRPSNDSDTHLLIDKLAGFDIAIASAYKRRGLPLATTDQDSIEIINSVEGSIGSSTMSIIKTAHMPIKAINFNGIEPSSENIKNGSYKLYKELYFCYANNNTSSALKDFLGFIQSREGKNILNKTGHYALQTAQ